MNNKSPKYKILNTYKEEKKYYCEIQCECGVVFTKRKDAIKDNIHCGCKKQTKKQLLTIGKVFGRLTVLDLPRGKGAGIKVKCSCECGTIKDVLGYSLLSGETSSCGCYNKDILKARAGENHPMYKGGLTLGSEYNLWRQVKDDCDFTQEKFVEWLKTNNGISVCKYDYSKPFSFDNMYLTDDEYVIKQNIENKRQQTCIDNFSSSSYSKTEEFELRRRKTNIEKFGVEYPIQNPEIKEQIKNTNLEKYGTEWGLSSNIIKEKIDQTNLERYGDKIASKSEEIKAKILNKMIESGRAHFIDNKTTKILSEEKGAAKSTLVKWIRKYGIEEALKMNKSQTSIEQKIKFFLEELNIKFTQQFRIDNKVVDFLLDDYNIMIEANGCYWHSDAIIENKQHHKNRKEDLNKLGYNVLFFNEDEINDKFDIIKSIINSKIQKNNRIFARKCIVKELTTKESDEFFNTNHLMGKGSGKGIGLFYNDELVCAMRIINKKDYVEISRFSHKINNNVIGGLSKLLSKLNGEIRSFIDLRYGDGKSLMKLGFVEQSNYLSFKWTYAGKTYHRLKYPSNSGYENKMNKLWDCGQLLLVKKYT